MSKALVVLLFSLFTISCTAGTGLKQKAVFAEKEIFQSNYFLKNVPGLVSDYNGQQVLYFADHNGVCVFFTAHGLIYKVTERDKKKANKWEHELKEEIQDEKEGKHEREGEKFVEEEKSALPTLHSYTSLQWIGANTAPEVEAVGQGSGYYTFLAGNSDAQLHSLVTNGFSKLIYHDLYPGIDVEYTFPEKGGLKYNLIVHPGADINQVSMQYGDAVKKLSVNKNGKLVIRTATGDIVEDAPVSFTSDNQAVVSSFLIHDKNVSFAVPNGYDHNKTLTIDPWVHVLTTLTVRELGISVDYDVAGNLYVYGAGAGNEQDTSSLQKVAKYDINGNLLWTFMGSVPSVWTSWGTGINNSGVYNNLGNAKVDKVANKVYVGKGFNYGGTQLIRLTSAGVYDNFISVIDTNFNEIWSFVDDCVTGDVLALGGGASVYANTHYNSMGVINPVTGVVATNNITGDFADHNQDVVSAAYDPSGNLYIELVNPFNAAINNHIYKLNSTYNGYIWDVYSGHNSFTEHIDMPTFYEFGSTSNFNAMAVNGSYIYIYDGKYLKAYNQANGSMVGAAYTIPGYDTTYQGGIGVDNCNNVYVGGIGVIKTFTFNGAAFTPQADIPLGAGFTTDTLFDVRYNSTNNLLYVTGTRIAGTYTATLSAACVVVDSFTSTVTETCTGAIVNVTPVSGLTNPMFSYLWEDSAGNILLQTTPSTSLSDTLSGLTAGHYTVQVQLNINCGGSSQTDSFTITSCNNLVVSDDTTICDGQSVILSATGTPSGGTYNWMPGNGNGATFTVSPAVSTTYIVTYTPTSGGPVTDSVHVNVTNAVSVTATNATICNGQSATISATPSLAGGTYSWAPGGQTTAAITVSPGATTTYTVTYTTAHCGAATDSGVVTVTSAPQVTVNDTTICTGQSATLSATPTVGGGTYNWAPGGQTSQSIIVSPISTSTYTVTYSTLLCGAATDSGIVTINSPVTLSTEDTTVCTGTNVLLTTTPSIGGGTYNWSPGGETTASITVSPTATTVYTVSYLAPGSVCPATSVNDSVVVTPVPTLSVTDTTICQGLSVVLTASPSQAGGTYLWSPGGASTQNVTVSPAATSIFTVTYVLSSCPAITDSGVVTITTPPTVSVSGQNANCSSADGSLWGVVAGGTSGYTYEWSNALHTTTDTLSGLVANSAETITVTDQSHCSVTASGLVGDNTTQLSIVLDSLNQITCYGLQNGSIAVHVDSCNNCNFLWSNHATGETVSGLSAGSYTVIASGTSGCADTASFNIVSPVQATLNIIPTDTNVNEGSPVIFTSIFGPYPSSSIVSYNWSPSVGLSCTSCPQPMFNSSAGTYQYSLTINYNNGCQVTEAINVIVSSQHILYIPNTFTPNGDGHNDVFQVYATGVNYIDLKVFDRWGEKMFETGDANIGWDGNYKGKPAPQAVYVYEFDITFNDGYSEHGKGSITLLK